MQGLTFVYFVKVSLCEIPIKSVIFRALLWKDHFGTFRSVMAVGAILISKAGNQFLNWIRPIRTKHWEVMFLGSLAHRNITSTVLNQNAERDFSDGFTLHWWRISMFTSKRFVHLSCLESLFEIKMVWVSCCWL